MTAARLSAEITQEELTAWAAYYQIKNEEEEKAMERAKQRGRTSSMGSK